MAALGNQVTIDSVLGTGSAINVSLGWIPDYVAVYNMTDGDLLTEGFLDYVIAFTSGGTTEVTAGAKLRGATSVKVTAIVKKVLLKSGTWAGGDAAGDLIVRPEDLVGGNFGSENVDLITTEGATSNVATVAAAAALNVATAAAVAGATGNNALSPYLGTSTAAKGFTIGSSVSESADHLRFIAIRNG